MRRNLFRNKLFQRLTALVFALVLVIAGLFGYQANQNNTTTVAATPTLGATGTLPPPTVVFPTVPPGGTTITVDHIFIHRSGVITLPHIIGWDVPAPQDTSEEVVSQPGSDFAQVGVTFINGDALSVIHAFANTKDPNRKATNAQELDQYWDDNQLKGAWSNFTGGYKVVDRNVSAEGKDTINFELYLNGSTYLARQISWLEGDWMMVLRLVVPNNNPGLVGLLQNAILPKYTLWTQALTVPVTWASVGDYVEGYVIKYPQNWTLRDGSPGKPYTIDGTSGPDNFTLTTRADPGDPVTTEDGALAWVKANIPNATPLNTKLESRPEGSGYSVSYSSPDADGNKRSGVVTLFSGSGLVFSINFLTPTRDLNLVDNTVVQSVPDLAQIRNSFFHITAEQLIATPTGAPTLTPLAITPVIVGGTTSTPAPGASTPAATGVATQGGF